MAPITGIGVGGSLVALDVVDVQGNRLGDLTHLLNKPVVPMDVVVVGGLTASLDEDSHVGEKNFFEVVEHGIVPLTTPVV